jgi:hypothetical protein
VTAAGKRYQFRIPSGCFLPPEDNGGTGRQIYRFRGCRHGTRCRGVIRKQHAPRSFRKFQRNLDTGKIADDQYALPVVFSHVTEYIFRIFIDGFKRSPRKNFPIPGIFSESDKMAVVV